MEVAHVCSSKRERETTTTTLNTLPLYWSPLTPPPTPNPRGLTPTNLSLSYTVGPPSPHPLPPTHKDYNHKLNTLAHYWFPITPPPTPNPQGLTSTNLSLSYTAAPPHPTPYPQPTGNKYISYMYSDIAQAAPRGGIIGMQLNFFYLLLFTILFYKKNSVYLEMTPKGIITNLYNNYLFIEYIHSKVIYIVSCTYSFMGVVV